MGLWGRPRILGRRPFRAGDRSGGGWRRVFGLRIRAIVSRQGPRDLRPARRLRQNRVYVCILRVAPCRQYQGYCGKVPPRFWLSGTTEKAQGAYAEELRRKVTPGQAGTQHAAPLQRDSVRDADERRPLQKAAATNDRLEVRARRPFLLASDH